MEAVEGADLLLIDGTFWTADEMIRLGLSEQTALEIGHMPVGGPEGSLQWLAQLPIRRRVYVHINNTNPMLNESSPEHREVADCGIAVGADGDSFEI